MNKQSELLIDILLDKSAREDERDDAAIDLRKYPESRVLEALTTVASDSNESTLIIDNCSESIGYIFVESNYFDEKIFRKTIPAAQKIIFWIVMTRKPEIINDHLKTEFKNFI